MLFVQLVAVLSAFGFPAGLIALWMHQRHQQKMKAIEAQMGDKQLAALESTRADLEARIRTLETIATGSKYDLEESLRRLVEAEKAQEQALLRSKGP